MHICQLICRRLFGGFPAVFLTFSWQEFGNIFITLELNNLPMFNLPPVNTSVNVKMK